MAFSSTFTQSKSCWPLVQPETIYNRDWSLRRTSKGFTERVFPMLPWVVTSFSTYFDWFRPLFVDHFALNLNAYLLIFLLFQLDLDMESALIGFTNSLILDLMIKLCIECKAISEFCFSTRLIPHFINHLQAKVYIFWSYILFSLLDLAMESALIRFRNGFTPAVKKY